MTEVTCDEAQDLLGDYFDGEAAREIVATIRHHLTWCKGCVVLVELYQATLVVTRSLPRHDEPIPPATAERLLRAMVAAE